MTARRFGGAGMRRSVRAAMGASDPPRWATDFNLVEGFRNGDADEYISPVGGEADAITGYIAGSVLTAESSIQRPTISGGGLVFSAASADLLRGGAALADYFTGVKPYSIVMRAYAVTSANPEVFAGVGVAASNTTFAALVGKGPTSDLARSVRKGESLFQIAEAGATTSAVDATFGVSFNGTTLTAYLNGSPGTPVGSPQNIGAVDVFGLGGIPRLTSASFANTRIKEVIVSNAAYSDALQAAAHARMVELWP